MLSILSALLLSTSVIASPSSGPASNRWNAKRFTNLITFGDSYTDESGLDYFKAHNGTAPPPGTRLPEGLSTSSGGRSWPRFVVQYTGNTSPNGKFTPQLDLHNYAVAGASCSHYITPRYLPEIHGDFPPVLGYQVPAYKADLAAPKTGYITRPTSSNAVYALWIGTNDLGVNCFLTDSQVPGKVLSDYTECVYQVFDQLYASGARHFVMLNTIPLELTPLYANATLYGTTAANATYWPDKPSNRTAIAVRMHQETTSVNSIFKYQTGFEMRIADRYPHAAFALFDVHSLFLDIYNQPCQYFNGTQPPDVTGAEHMCDGSGNNCVYAYNRTSSDSFMWYDALHPSVQTSKIVAQNFVEVINGRSKYATYY